MRLIVVGREMADYARTVSEWVREYERRTGREVEMIDPDSGEGLSLCRAYDIVEYPTMLALNEGDGAVLGMWRGTSLPTFDEVTYWATK